MKSDVALTEWLQFEGRVITAQVSWAITRVSFTLYLSHHERIQYP